DTRRVRWLGRHDVPHFDGRGAPCLMRLHRPAYGGLVRHIDELALIGQIEPVIDGREQRSSGHHAWCRRGPSRTLLELECPRIAAHVEDRGDTATQIGAEESLGPGLERRL